MPDESPDSASGRLASVESELDALVRRFRTCTLPKPEWTHRAHLGVGLWHVDRYGRDESLVRLRSGIRRLNDSHGTVNSETSGYHETVTRAYLALLSEFTGRFSKLPLADRLASLLSGPLADKEVLLAFYSRARLMSAEARMNWLEPDREPLSLAAVLGRAAEASADGA